MGELSNALQGRLSSRKGHVKDPSEKQLDLFSSLSDREATAPKIIMSKPETPPEPRPEPEMVLPAAPPPPPDVAADVRAVLSESMPVAGTDEAAADERPPLRTGVYHRPQRSAAPPPPPRAAPPAPAPAGKPGLWTLRLREWLAGVELDRRMISLIVLLVVLVGIIGFWSACPRTSEESADVAESTVAPAPDGDVAPVVPVPVVPVASPAPAAASAAAVPPPVSGAGADWKIPGAETVLSGGAYLLKFMDPVFESGDMISIKGMAALKALAAKLASAKAGTRVVVTGYTDDQPLSKPTERFKTNADIAAARAQAAIAQLAARTGPGLAYEARTGEPAQAPFPNDTPQNRRLNRTVTVQVIPAP